MMVFRFCCALLFSYTLAATALELGIRADQLQIEKASIVEPILSKTKKSLVTQNQFGFDILETESNWVIEDFIARLEPKMVVLDVGAGYGGLTRAALKKGATVISNDLSKQHLFYHLKHTTYEEQQRLYLNDQDIRNLSFTPKSLDVVMVHRVLHFFKGAEIEVLLEKMHRWLKPGGILYIVMMSKDHGLFRDKIVYDVSKKWPGEDLVISRTHLPEQAYALPETLHVMAVETLNPVLERHGFEVKRAGFVSVFVKHTHSDGSLEPFRDGKEAVGFIALKKH